MSAKLSGLNPKGPYLSLEKENETFCVVFAYSVKPAREIRIESIMSQSCSVQKKRDARAKLLFY